MDSGNDWGSMRNRIIGLGEQSNRKSYYPELQRKVAELENARQQLLISEASMRAIFNSVTEAIFIQDPETGSILDVNHSMRKMYGYASEDELPKDLSAFSSNEPPYTLEGGLAFLRKVAAGEPQCFEWHARKKSGELFWVEVLVSCALIGAEKRLIATVRDVTARMQAEEERERLQAQFLQAQKMESVGRLAGGVAHDFNNMLGVILGHVDLALDRLQPSDPLYADIVGIREAAERSAVLTRQLLAFARKQTASPKVLDLNATVEGMLKMLRRLIGEDIELSWLPGKDARPIRMDPSQIDQILANLCVNARDSISGVGKVMIETGTVFLDESYCYEHVDFHPGEYVVLAVSDTGCGMDKEVLGRIFEPFFTTKEKGRGTGLGLATVYGIVKQNNGLINVYSEPGIGTTFKIYLPAALDQAVENGEAYEQEMIKGSGETILLVEDEPASLGIGKAMLERLGYTVLAAETPNAAILLAEDYTDKICLMITDVVMPEMNGRELSERMKSVKPGMKCLYMSGYTADVIARQGKLEKDINFISKPFTIRQLAIKVREAMAR